MQYFQCFLHSEYDLKKAMDLLIHKEIIHLYQRVARLMPGFGRSGIVQCDFMVKLAPFIKHALGQQFAFYTGQSYDE